MTEKTGKKSIKLLQKFGLPFYNNFVKFFSEFYKIIIQEDERGGQKNNNINSR